MIDLAALPSFSVSHPSERQSEPGHSDGRWPPVAAGELHPITAVGTGLDPSKHGFDTYYGELLTWLERLN